MEQHSDIINYQYLMQDLRYGELVRSKLFRLSSYVSFTIRPADLQTRGVAYS